MTRLQILFDGKEVMDREVVEVTIDDHRNLMEVESDPQMAAIMAGASVEQWQGLPGRETLILDMGSELTVTYVMQFRTQGKGVIAHE